jgi:hypothetical protein
MRGVYLLSLLMLGMLLGSLTPASVLDSVDARLQVDAGRAFAAQLPVEGSAAAKRLAEASRNAELTGGAKLLDRAVANATTSAPDPRAITLRSSDGAGAKTIPAHPRTLGPRAPPTPPRP